MYGTPAAGFNQPTDYQSGSGQTALRIPLHRELPSRRVPDGAALVGTEPNNP